ncbi:MAG TPA: sigma-54 dependent transcriptional regulator, partial [Planctomycetota bacterium]|nr:sigma-54 dependent transcriptional regulator [Planctomycetota bacterium]
MVADAAMVRVFEMVRKVAPAPSTVLILGETGVGKEVIAEALHMFSQRVVRPLVKLNCAAIPAELLESELFGHVRGAFSGAVDDKAGLFEAAHGGTLFLDEIGDMPLAMQAKLLRAVDDGRIRRVGATAERAVDVRFLAATHRRLAEQVEAGAFREDLYYRLSAFVLEVPPLRERQGEILHLAHALAEEMAAAMDLKPVELTAAARARLQAHRWPGNIRELRNVISAALVRCNGRVIDAADLGLPAVAEPDSPPPPADDDRELDPGDWSERENQTTLERIDRVPLERALREFERRRILSALEAAGGNRGLAAERLGLPRRTLNYKMKA